MLRTDPRESRAELMQADLSWFAMYLIKQCIDAPPDEMQTLALVDDALRELATIRNSWRYAARGHKRGHG